MQSDFLIYTSGKCGFVSKLQKSKPVRQCIKHFTPTELPTNTNFKQLYMLMDHASLIPKLTSMTAELNNDSF